MRMQETIDAILKEIQRMATDKGFMEKHKSREEDFSRKRNLVFEELIYFVMGNLGTSFDFEVLNFSANREMTVSTAAVCKARDKIKFTAYEDIFRTSAKQIPVTNTYKGYRLTAYDGMKGELPRTKELMNASNTSEKMTYPQFHAIAEYDVLNCCYTNAIFKLGTADEREAAIELIEKHEHEGKEIFLYDRGFPSLRIIQLLEKSGKGYVMRVSKSFLREVNEFGKSSAKDKTIQIIYDKRRAATNRVSGEGLPYSFKLRCVRIEPNSGEDEILVTNLDESEFSRKDIGELYNLRWKIETGFLHLKYAVCILNSLQ
jgi:hypothetical protein